MTAAERAFTAEESLGCGGEGSLQVGFAVCLLHHFDGPGFEVDGRALGGLDKSVVILYGF